MRRSMTREYTKKKKKKKIGRSRRRYRNGSNDQYKERGGAEGEMGIW
jgi:hypothetical protein